jgi:hypothetical protein
VRSHIALSAIAYSLPGVPHPQPAAFGVPMVRYNRRFPLPAPLDRDHAGCGQLEESSALGLASNSVRFQQMIGELDPITAGFVDDVLKGQQDGQYRALRLLC